MSDFWLDPVWAGYLVRLQLVVRDPQRQRIAWLGNIGHLFESGRALGAWIVVHGL